MAIILEEISTINAVGQTTVPKTVRQALGIDNGGRIIFRMSGGRITVSRADDDEDPAIEVTDEEGEVVLEFPFTEALIEPGHGSKHLH